jgi:hypothetical protein
MVCGLRWKTCNCEYFTFGPEDELQQMNVPQRLDKDATWDDDEPPPLPRDLRSFAEGGRRIVRRATYEDEPSRRMAQIRHDEDIARRLQYEPSDDEDGYDVMDSPHDAVGMGPAASHHVSEDYRRSSGRAHRRATPPGMPHDRAGYVADVSRARGVRASSMERRLADRLSEHRHGGGHRTELPLGRPPPPMSSPPMMGGPPIGRPAFAPMAPAPMAPSMGMSPAPAAPQVPLHVPMAPPILPPTPHHPMMGMPYPPQMTMDRPPFGGMMGPEATPPMVRRRRASDGAPRSSMAGLTVPGGGMNRVFEWRTFVEPGIPEGEGVPG